MIRLASLALKGPYQAVSIATIALVLSLVISPLIVISSAIVALVWLRNGSRQGLVLIAGSLLLAMAMTFFAKLPPSILLQSAVIYWLPVVVMAVVLRATVSLSLALLAGAVLSVFLAYLFQPPADELAALLRTLLLPESGGQVDGRELSVEEKQAVEQFIDMLGQMFAWFQASTLYLMITLGLLLGRSWQAGLFNPGGFGQEFRTLRFDRRVAIGALFLILVAIVVGLPVLQAAAMVAMMAFMFQGLAVLHANVAATRLSQHWLIAAYVLLVLLLPVGVVVIGSIGIRDTWANYRAQATSD